MRKYFMTSRAMLVWLLVSAGTACAKPSAPITDVLLYPGGATIVRTVQVSPGMTQVVITGLPTAFDMQTLHAEAGAGVRIGEIVSNDVASTHAINPAEAKLEAKITALRDKLEQLDAEAKAAQMAVDYLVRLMAGSGAPRADDHHPAPPMDPKTLTGLANAMRTEAGKSLARLQQIAVQKREITRNIDALQRDLDRLHTGGTDTRALTINFTATRAGALRVSYQVSNAGWRPAYRASLNSDTSKVELERHAIISQKTGEDWSNVHLTLSTSQPRLATSGVDPQPWLLSYAMAGARGGYVAAAPMAAEAPVPAQMAKAKKAQADKRETGQENGEEVEEDTYTPPTFETQGMFATEFEVPARTSLPSDGREVSVELTRQEIAVKQYFQTVPRQEAAVYVTAEAEMPQGDWPQGNMQLFRNGSYVGSSAWYPQAKDKLVLGFGRDEQVRVSITPLKADASSSGIISKHKQKKIATLFSFVNLHQQPIELRVLEASPVATSDEISVRTIFEPKPTRETWEDRRGVVAWEVKLAPKATSKIKTEYEIDYPGEGELVNQRW